MAGRLSSGSIRGPSRSNSSSAIPGAAEVFNGLENGYVVDKLTQYAGSERVKVVARVRPCIHADEQTGAVEVSEDQRTVIVNRQETSVNPQTAFTFDTVLPLEANQHEVYNAAVRDIVGDVLRGYNGTVMVYGQTGAGKTYTLGNIEPHAIGMIPRAAAEIFKRAADDTKQIYTITMAYIQIYMETIQDLLKPESDNLQLREDANGVFVAGVHEQAVSSVEQCLHYLELGERNRVFAFTHMNAHSSRSHAVVMLTVRKRSRVMTQREQDEMAKFAKDGVTPRRIKVGKLFLVDLAGSERLKKSKSEGLRQTEAIHINKSLSTLGNCINARANNSPHVPFRESKLTRLLQESLGGNTKTTLIICVSDVKQHMEETLQTLQFGSRAMCVRVKPMVNESIDYKAITDQVMSDLHDKNGVLDALSKAQLSDLQEQFEQEKEHFQTLITALEKEREEEGSQRKKMTEAMKTKDQELEKQTRLLESHKAKLDSFVEDKAKLEKQVEEMKAQQRVLTHRHELEKSRLQASLADAISRLEATQAQQHAEVTKLKAQLADKQRQMSVRHDKEMQEALASCEATVKEAQREWQQHAEKVVQQKEREMKEAQAAHESNLREVRRKLETDIGEVKMRFASLHERYCKLQDNERKMQEDHSKAVQRAQELAAQLQKLQVEKDTQVTKLRSEKESFQKQTQSETEALKKQMQDEKESHMAQLQAEKESYSKKLQAEKEAQMKELHRQKEAHMKELQAEKEAHSALLQSQKEATYASASECKALKDALLQLVSVANTQMRSVEKNWQLALDRQDARLNKVHVRVSEVGAAYDRLQMHRDGLQEKVHGRGEELRAKEDKLNAAGSQVSELTAALVSEQRVVKDLTTALHASQSQYQDQSTELRAAQSQVHDLTAALNSAEARVQQLTGELHTSQSKARGLDQDLQASLTLVQDLTSGLQSSESDKQALAIELQEAQARADGLDVELTNERANSHALSVELSATQDNVKALSAALQSAEARERDLTMQLHESRSNASDLGTQLEASESTVARLMVDLQGSRENVRDLHAQVASHLQTINQKDGEIAENKAEIAHKVAEVAALTADLESIQAALEDVRGQLNYSKQVGEQQQQQIVQWGKQIDARNVQIRGLQQELEDTKEVARQQEAAIAEQETKLQDLQLELDDRQEQLDDRQHEILTLSAKLEKRDSQLQAAHKHRLALEAQLERHQSERMSALRARSVSRRQVWAVLAIQRAWRQYRTRRLQKHLHERGTTINRLDQQRTEWQKTAYQLEAKQRQALARWGADITREAVSVGLKGAVENIMAAFVLPKKEMEAFMNAKNRMNHFSPMVSPSPASMNNLSPMHAGLQRNTPSPFHPAPSRELAPANVNGMATARTALFRSPKSGVGPKNMV